MLTNEKVVLKLRLIFCLLTLICYLDIDIDFIQFYGTIPLIVSESERQNRDNAAMLEEICGLEKRCFFGQRESEDVIFSLSTDGNSRPKITNLIQDFYIFQDENSKIQEVPSFRDFWFQKVIMKCEDHEFQYPKLCPNIFKSPVFEPFFMKI